MDDWKTVTIKDVCEIRPPKKEASQKLSPDDLVSFVPMENLGILTKALRLETEKTLADVQGSYTYFADNDVLLAKITPCFENGKLGIARNLTNGVGFGSSEYVVLRSKGAIDPEYLFYFLSQDSFRQNGARVMTGAVGHKRVPKEFIENHLIPLPSLPEQKRIVAILDEAFAAIDQARANAERNKANARELFDSYLNAIFANPAPDWEEILLGVSCQFFNGKAHEQVIEQEGQYKVVNSKFIATDGEIAKKTKQALFPLYSGDIVMVMSDVPNGKALAKCFLIDLDNVYTLNQRICCIRSNVFVTRFLFHQLNRHKYLLSFDNGENQTNLRKNDILKCPLYVPSPEEQMLIAERIDQFIDMAFKLESTYQDKIDALDELKQSLLHQAFTGQLTKTPDEVLEALPA